MAVGLDRRASKAASGLEHALLLRPLDGTAMSFDPMVHPSGIALPVNDTTTPAHSSEDRFDLNPTPALTPHQAAKKRRSSKAKVGPEIRRSSSTPHMRNLALATSGELSPTGDKRRNKLGYHRTSVACGHCRRRKIRCLVAAEDPQGRCANCIRLKKECNFFPVEQNPEPQRSQTGSVKEGTSVAPASTTSSPHHPSSEKMEDFRPPFPGPGPNASVARFGVPSDADTDAGASASAKQLPLSTSAHIQHAAYAYPQPIDTQWPPTGFLPSSSVAESPSSSSGYWRPSPSATTSNYGSDTNLSGGQTPATVSTTSNMSYGGPHDGHGWAQPNMQPPTRSMSYGNIEHYSSPGMGLPSQDYPRRTSPYPYPPPLDTHPSAVHSTTLGDTTSAPLSAPLLSHQQFSYPPNWNPYSAMPNTPHEMPAPTRSMSAQWAYSEHTPLGQVQEEGVAPMAYSHGMTQFYSGA
ncbi:hypothetical protein EJ04DRAFT_104139 [Polyplosphaeria fusca]|uniref:Zn(2)-C6 fungal-type domain-containing protein n=1 Tax=Polyplosphaeria fusca TaxID=682080 RepID=A0A9P4R704_9PLEO|nr:hypothetical protein EJ04DRAFT_104139 [Polyplosphaeria fusca]